MDLNLHKVLYLYKTADKFYIQPVENPSEALVIDRRTCEITSSNIFSTGLLPANATSCLIYGIIGIKHLISCAYLLVITRATQIGSIDEKPIYRMDQAQVIPFNDHLPKPREGQTDWNEILKSMLEHVLSTPSFYFSYAYDLTNSRQRVWSLVNESVIVNLVPNHEKYDKRFLWNSHVMRDFDRIPDVTNRYRLPFILGFVSTNRVCLDNNLNWVLISRRSVHRAGTRFNSRGIDDKGHVSNFVETEQIIEELNICQASHVQVRGSIPLYWSQKANYKYKPAIEIDRANDHEIPMKKHFSELLDCYNAVSVVNLIDSHGHEGELERQFSSTMSNLRNVPYHYFDFHKECSRMRWDRLSILMGQIGKEIDNYGYFADNGRDVHELQRGIIRSNCIDSLDRTNVVQSMIAQRVLQQQLSRFNFISPGSSLNAYEDFMFVFKNAWADNADALSIQYAGTPALKTDFTRTGKRTKAGLVQDGINSLTRYVSNNFQDSYRQDAIDLFLGNFEGYPSPLFRPLDITSYTSSLPLTIVVLTFVILYIYLRF